MVTSNADELCCNLTVAGAPAPPSTRFGSLMPKVSYRQLFNNPKSSRWQNKPVLLCRYVVLDSYVISTTTAALRGLTQSRMASHCGHSSQPADICPITTIGSL